MSRTPIVILAALAAAIAGCEKPSPPPSPPPLVLTHTVRPAVEEALASFPGEVRARHEADLGFRVAGKLVERPVDVGAAVRRGDVLARLDGTDVALSAQAAAAQLAAARTDTENARIELERARALAGRNFVSGAVLDARQNAFNAASARLDQARAQAELAANQSGYATLAASDAGVVTAVFAEPGQVLAAGQPVVRVARTAEREIWISVPESRIPELRGPAELVAMLWVAPERRYRARVREIAPQADPATRSFQVKLALLDADADVRLGMTANVFLRLAAGTEAVRVPASALGSREGRPVVWTIGDGGTVQPRPVAVQAYARDGVLLGSGLRAGESIVAAGVHKLSPGQSVRVLPGEGARAAK